MVAFGIILFLFAVGSGIVHIFHCKNLVDEQHPCIPAEHHDYWFQELDFLDFFTWAISLIGGIGSAILALNCLVNYCNKRKQNL